MRARLVILLAVGGVALAVAAQALADLPPDQVLPEDGAQFTAQPGQITFQASTTAIPSPAQMDFYISEDTQTNPVTGVLSNSINVVHGGSTGGDPPVYAASPNPNETWPVRPGTYYWQAVYHDCDQSLPPDCFNESTTIRSLTINPLPAAAVTSASQVETFLDHHPRRRTRNRKVMFHFSSNVAGASFRCLFAKGWADCKSPHTFRHLKPGRYKFEARAVVNGLDDPTPVSWVFRVLRRDRD